MRNREPASSPSGFKQVFSACFLALWPAYLLASLLIFWGFAWSLPDGRRIDKSFHADENAAVWGINQIHFPGFNPHVFNWGTALFYQVYALRMLVSLGGLIHIGDTGLLLLGRVVVWASALGAITCLYLLCREIFDEWTSRCAALLLAVLPGFILNSHYLKTDVPMTFWLTAAMAAGYRLLATGNQKYVYALGLLAGYSISTKYSAVAVIPACLVFLAMAGPSVRKLRAAAVLGICIGIGFLAGTPRILPDPREFLAAIHQDAGIGETVGPTAIARGPAGLDYLTRISRLSMTTPVWLAAGVGAAWLAARRLRALLPIWAFLAAYVVVLSADNVRLVRYTVPLLPFAAIFVAALAAEFRRVWQTAPLATAGAWLLAAYALVFTASYVRVMSAEDPRVQASLWIAQHVPHGASVPVSTTHYLGAPQIRLWGYRAIELRTDVEQLKAAASPYLAISEYTTQNYDGALNSFPAARQFFDYVRDNYTEVARFENSQRLLGIDSKTGLTVTHDWLYPNPRITLYQRKSVSAGNLVK